MEKKAHLCPYYRPVSLKTQGTEATLGPPSGRKVVAALSQRQSRFREDIVACIGRTEGCAKGRGTFVERG